MRSRALAAWMLALALTAAAAAAEPAPAAAFKAPLAEKAPMLAAARAGQRIVAVGDYGTVLLSDDEGRSWRQADRVPSRETLTALSFIDARHGWAVGHGGLVLATVDGGATWEQRYGAGKDVALFAVRFADAERGLAVGAFGFAMETRDGGRNWQTIGVAQGNLADRHLYNLFRAGNGELWITAESGTLFHATADGKGFAAVALPAKASMWGGLALADGGLLVWGMRGRVLRSGDGGRSWHEVPSGTQQALTAGVQLAGGEIVLAGLGGAIVRSRDGGRSFVAEIRPERQSHTALIESGGALQTFTLAGIGGRINASTPVDIPSKGGATK